MRKTKVSLQWSLMATIVIGWLSSVVIVVCVAGVMLGASYRRSVEQEIHVAAQSAMGQIEALLDSTVSSSKAVSYDGVIRSAYRDYLRQRNSVQLYRRSKDYLTQRFSRDGNYKAVLINYWYVSTAQPYVVEGDAAAYEITQTLRKHTDMIQQTMRYADTDIRLLCLDGELYLARNLLSSDFAPYATVAMMLSGQQFSSALAPMRELGDVQLSLGATVYQVDEKGVFSETDEQWSGGNVLQYDSEVDGHPLALTAVTPEYDLWNSNPWLRWAVAGVAAMLLPMLTVIIVLFTYHLSDPMQVLAEASRRIQSGERGYQIRQKPPNVEFENLYTNFNAMSAELKSQFERSFLEQQATQNAQIKALQSQINPHFLNNTLEIINWEARIAENERVSAMIEALSTMLDAALDRDGRSRISLQQELVYVDAYLYIIHERLGDGFRVHKEIDESVLERTIPRLILQPIVENAVEHDITQRRGGDLCVRANRQGDAIVLEVEHDGTMSETDRENILSLLGDEEPQKGSSVGLRNVSRRLHLIYGERATLTIDQTPSETVLARICFPMEG